MYPSSRIFFFLLFSPLSFLAFSSLLSLPAFLLVFFPSIRDASSFMFHDRLRLEAFLPIYPRLLRGFDLFLTSVQHPSPRSSMISSSRCNEAPLRNCPDSLSPFARLTGSRRSGYLVSKRCETWTRPNERIIDRRVPRSVIKRLPEAAWEYLLDAGATSSQVRRVSFAFRILRRWNNSAIFLDVLR